MMKKKWSFRGKKKATEAPVVSPRTLPHRSADLLSEKPFNLITAGTQLQGKILFDQSTRMAGHIQGEVESRPGTSLIITQEGLIEGNITADEVLIQGFVEGEIRASTRITVASGGRVLGSLHSPSVQLEFGAWFEGECRSGSALTDELPTS